jgi:hypothetical protein
MQAEGGAAGFVDIVSRLLNATFGNNETDKASEDRAPGKLPQACRDPL